MEPTVLAGPVEFTPAEIAFFLAVLAGIFVAVMAPGWAVRGLRRPPPPEGAAARASRRAPPCWARRAAWSVCCAVSALVGALLGDSLGSTAALLAVLASWAACGAVALRLSSRAEPDPRTSGSPGPSPRRRVGTMIPELHLADPTRCPSCSAPLTAERDACRACGLRLTGPLAQQLWQVSVQAAELLDRRAALIAQLRREPAATAWAPVGSPPASAGPATTQTAPPRAARTRWAPPRVVSPQGAEPAARPGRRAAGRGRGHLPGRLLGQPRRRRALGRDGGRDRAGRRRRPPHPPRGPDLDRRVALAAHRGSGGAGLLRRPVVGPGRARRRRRRALLGGCPDGRGGPDRRCSPSSFRPGPSR